MHNVGYIKEKNEINSCLKEDRSYTPMRYDFILQKVYYDFADIFQTCSLKPSLDPDYDGCPN